MLLCSRSVRHTVGRRLSIVDVCRWVCSYSVAVVAEQFSGLSVDGSGLCVWDEDNVTGYPDLYSDSSSRSVGGVSFLGKHFD